MKTNEETLSDKTLLVNEWIIAKDHSKDNFLKIEDVKSFIKKLKEFVHKMDYEEGLFCGEEGELMLNEIDTLAGKELIE